MKKLPVLLLLIILVSNTYAQQKSSHHSGVSAEENLRAISKLSAYSTGGVGFDTRYKGVKGSPMLFDTLLTSYIKITKQESYIQIESDIDLVSNSIYFVNPGTSQMVSVSAGNINEVIFTKGNDDMIFRTIMGSLLKKNSDSFIFYQVLYDGTPQLIKVPVKDFIAADYKQAYSPGRQYDEFSTSYKYYIISADGTIRQCQLTLKSLTKIFPGKKSLIKDVTKGKSYPDKELMVIEVLKNF